MNENNCDFPCSQVVHYKNLIAEVDLLLVHEQELLMSEYKGQLSYWEAVAVQCEYDLFQGIIEDARTTYEDMHQFDIDRLQVEEDRQRELYEREQEFKSSQYELWAFSS